jgi:hypothetical protein
MHPNIMILGVIDFGRAYAFRRLSHRKAPKRKDAEFAENALNHAGRSSRN